MNRSSRYTLLLALLLSLASSTAQAQQPRVIRPEKHARSALPVRDLDQVQSSYQDTGGPHPVRLFPLPPQRPSTDPVRQEQMGTVRAEAGEGRRGVQNFDGLGSQDNVSVLGRYIAPPDPNIAVGANHIVEMVNTLFAVYSKSGALVAGPEPIKDLWTGFDGPCETENDGDPIVLYDEYAGRWVLSQFALFDTDGDGLDDTSAECVAVSETSDPTGYYYLYAFEMSGLNDYPKLGVGPDSYLYTHNQFSEGFGSYMGAVAGAFEREAMLNGQEAEMVLFGPNPDRSSILPADSDGPIPSGDPPGVFAELKTSTSQIAIYHLDVDWAF